MYVLYTCSQVGFEFGKTFKSRIPQFAEVIRKIRNGQKYVQQYNLKSPQQINSSIET